jgi:hypothetical protein
MARSKKPQVDGDPKITVVTTSKRLENPTPLDMETAVRCTRCQKLLKTEHGDAHRIGVYKNNVCTEVICTMCSSDEKIRDWGLKGELSSGLCMDAQSAVTYIDEFKDTSRLRPDYAEMFMKHIGVYREVHRQITEVYDAARKAEIAVWFGRPDLATDEMVKKSHEWAQNWHDRYELEWAGKPVPTLFELGPNSVKAYYEKSPSAGHSYYCDDFKILMLGTAGRLLTTISDTRGQDNPESKFGGAHITLIFDETSKDPRGGVQSHIGTQKELLGLIEAYRRPEVKFKADKKVSIF